VDVKSSSVLSGFRDEARRHVPDRQFIAKIEMAMRCSSVGGEDSAGGSEVWLHARVL